MAGLGIVEVCIDSEAAVVGAVVVVGYNSVVEAVPGSCFGLNPD